MKLACPICKTQLKQNEINIETNVAHCKQCNEVFKIADYLRGSEEIRRPIKPVHSNISIEKINKENEIRIPPKGWDTQSILLFCFSLLWNVAIFSFIFLSSEGSSVFMLGLFVIVGMITLFYSIFLKTCKIIIHYRREILSVSWVFLGLKYSKTNEGWVLEKIAEEVMYTRNYQPVYGIAMYFRYNRKIKFGSWLNEDERKWLIGELYEMKIEFDERRKN